jgi:O-antigen/teichoic acid export membrane protein
MIDFIKSFFDRFKDSLYYFGSSLIMLPIALFTTPIFARNLSAYDFSAIGYFGALMQIFTPLLSLSFYSYYMVDYHKRTDNENQKVLSSLVSFLLLSNIFIILFGYLGILLYLKLSNSEFSAYPLGLIVLVTGYFAIGKGFWLLKLRFDKKAFDYFIISTISALIGIGLGILFVSLFKMGAAGKLIPLALIEIIAMIIFLRKYLVSLKFDMKIIRNAFLLGLPIILESLLNLPVLAFDRLVVEKINNVNEFALYNIGFSFSGYLFTFGSSLLMAFEPEVFKMISYGHKKDVIKMFFGFVFIMLFVNTSFLLVSKPMINFLTAGRYSGSVLYANNFIFSQSLLLFTYFIGFIATALRLTRIELIIKIFISLLSIFLIISLVGKYSFMGAIYAKYITYGLWAFLLSLALYYRKTPFIKYFQVIEK